MNIVITGTSKGIGLELTKQALRSGNHVLAVARNINGAHDLKKLQESHTGQLELLEVDLYADEAVKKIKDALSTWPHIDVLINNAGVLLHGEEVEDFNKSFLLNSTVPFLLTKALMAKLKKAPSPKVAFLTSQMGSIEDNSSGGYHVYRSSKAALNMLVKGLSIDEPWLTCVMLHPGWVKTRMGGAGAHLAVEDSAHGLWKEIQKAHLQESGKFINFKGESLPW